MDHELNRLSVNSLQKGSKTFSLAARFFPKEEFEAAAKVYFWCRSCDDYIDEREADERDIEVLRIKTFHMPEEPEFLAFHHIRQQYKIPNLYPQELLSGMHMDIIKKSYRTLKELELYAYRVAGTVGLMMSHVMGLYDEKALEQAAKLGMAMQLTNIARDVKEDQKRGRVYLPQEWLNETEDIFEVVRKVLQRADELYIEGEKGIIHLPLKSALAVTMASAFYKEIGREILRIGHPALEYRVVISLERKAVLAFKAIGSVLKTLPYRWNLRREKVEIRECWSLT